MGDHRIVRMEQKRRAAARRQVRPKVRAENTIERVAPASWTFLTNHSHVLILLASEPSLVLREVASRVGITERAVQRIIVELEEGGFLKREKVGRQNRYEILTSQPLRHSVESHCTIGDLLALINGAAA